MRAIPRFVARLWNLATGKRSSARMQDEMQDYIAMQTEENLRGGMASAEARRQAMLKQYHAEEGLPLIETMLQDVCFAGRILRKTPVFTAVAVLTLALGIGANAAIFTLINALMLKNRPVASINPIQALRVE